MCMCLPNIFVSCVHVSFYFSPPLIFTLLADSISHFVTAAGADPGFFLGGGALVSCSTSTLINHIFFFFWQDTTCTIKPQVISGGGGAHPLHPPPRSAPGRFECPCFSPYEIRLL